MCHKTEGGMNRNDGALVCVRRSLSAGEVCVLACVGDVYGFTVIFDFMKRKLRHSAVNRTHDSNLDTFIAGLEYFYRYIYTNTTYVMIGDMSIDCCGQIYERVSRCWIG